MIVLRERSHQSKKRAIAFFMARLSRLNYLDDDSVVQGKDYLL